MKTICMHKIQREANIYCTKVIYRFSSIKEKNHKISIVQYLLYIKAISPMVYIGPIKAVEYLPFLFLNQFRIYVCRLLSHFYHNLWQHHSSLLAPCYISSESLLKNPFSSSFKFFTIFTICSSFLFFLCLYFSARTIAPRKRKTKRTSTTNMIAGV